MMYKMIAYVLTMQKTKIEKNEEKKPMKRMMKRAEKIALTEKGYNCVAENVV